MVTLHDKPFIQDNLSGFTSWQQNAFGEFSKKLSDNSNQFPCIPAITGFKLNHFRYSFIRDPRKQEAASDLAHILGAYGKQSQNFGRYTSLITFFETPKDLLKTHTVDDYRKLFWELLNKISKLDVKDWPSHIPLDPHNPIWEYCFDGEQYFMYCATPAHERKKSRSFPYFTFAVTPRWVLEEFSASTRSAALMKRRIRDRIDAYDSIGVHPDLNTYGIEQNFEWKQYFLSDDNSTPIRCPFLHSHTAPASPPRENK